MSITRREFLKSTFARGCLLGAGGCVLSKSGLFSIPLLFAQENQDTKGLREAMFYDKLENFEIKCQTCPKECKIPDTERGYCGNKENRGGKYYCLFYNKVCSFNTDPVEKKPLFHYMPGTSAFSISCAGCNFECKFCQNWEISQFRPEDVPFNEWPPEKVIEIALKKSVPTIAFTYGEPVVFYEYAYDIAKLAKEKKVNAVMISNGYIKKDPLKKICECLSAIKVDFKGYSEKFYKDQCAGELKYVLETLKNLKEIGIWFELVTLVIPGLNDNKKELQDMGKWIADNLGPDVPVHFTKFHPEYKLMNLPVTPMETLETAAEAAEKAGLNYVYIGNVSGNKKESTFCPKCKKNIVKRLGFAVLENHIDNGKCKFCSQRIPGVWEMQ
ncbi:MAG: AmmeMemoRadiSam system radical SAM enzyme [Planctomycetes bacterium]|nr:AmmeMemoRadiSam system radical SAM enzyme [Planctomycetota bacterium]